MLAAMLHTNEGLRVKKRGADVLLDSFDLTLH